MAAGCNDDDSYGTPKPRGYFRIDMPEKKYVSFESECPFIFALPDYAKAYKSAAPNAEPCWRDIFFGQFRATLYLSYKQVPNDSILRELINQNWQLFEAHDQAAGGIRDSTIIRDDEKVYGAVVSLGGNAASQVQFYLTDSVHHFLRGSLYFYATPNKDSLAPVLNFLKKDIFQLAYSLKWKDAGNKQGNQEPGAKSQD